MFLGQNFAQTYNYAEALQKSMFYYECQRSGTLPATNRVNWRGNSGLKDGSDVGKDLTGGLYDAGDNVKFGFPLAYTATALAWGAVEYQAGYTSSGQLSYLKSNLRWITDYLIKCHTAPNELYGQVGNGGTDHAWWGSCEVMQMARPAYKIDATHPGSDLAGETAAALAAASMVFATDDPTYSATLLSHAKQLYTFADTYRGKYSDAITDAGAYYNSWSGYQDEIVWGAIWLYRATNDPTYLAKAETEYDKLAFEGQSTTDHSYKWTIAWDDKTYGCYVLLAKLTGKAKYMTDAEHWLDFWTTGYNGAKITYTPGGLAWLDSWGSLRYAANTSFCALVYSAITTDATKKATYANFAKSQINYILGNNPNKRSLMCGYGVNPPINPHHRTAHGAWANNLTGPPTNSRHTIYGAVIGGPDSGDGYTDDRSNYGQNEPACDYNALFSGALAKLVIDNGGTALSNFPVAETPTGEYLVEAKINGTGPTYTEYSVWVDNHTAWPSRIPTTWKFRLFVNISEGITAGYKATDYVVSANGSSTTFTNLTLWDASKNIYYTEVTYVPSIMIWPGGQGESTEETQIRIRLPYEALATSWDPTNDPAYQGMTTTLTSVTTIPLYVDGKLVVGVEPPIGQVISVTGVTLAPTTAAINVGATAQLTATVAPSTATNKTVTFTSSSTAVATVSSTGLVTGVAAGTATITVTTADQAKTATCVVTVSTVNVPVTGVTVAPATLTMSVGATSQLTATVVPANATNKNVTWSSNSTPIITVSSTGVVTAVAVGSGTITATTVDGLKTATCLITVSNSNVAVTGITIAPTTASILVGSTTPITATIAPTNATNKTINFTSSNTAIATVGSTGLVTGVTAGTTNITATTVDGSFTAICLVTVSVGNVPVTGVTIAPATVSVNVAGTSQLTATVAPANATNKNVTWSSSNTAIATVSSTGLVTGVALGSATITVTTVDQAKTATSVITVGTSVLPCSNPVAITIPFKNDGIGEFCWSTTQTIAYVNSWNMALVEINGVDFTNKWSSSMPAAINGTWYIHYKGSFSWSHFEASATKSASAMEEETTISLYPNPFSESIVIRISKPESVNEVLVIDQLGSVVKRLSKSEISDAIQIGSELKSGMYIVKIVAQQHATSYKIIKK